MSNNYTVKQVIVVRKDLNMRKGKLAAQVAHASSKVLLDRMFDQHFNSNKKWLPYADENETEEFYLIKAYFTESMIKWITGSFAKIVVSCDSEEELYKIYELAKQNNLPSALIIDNGSTEFHGEKTATCIAIGPADSEKIDVITKDLKLL